MMDPPPIDHVATYRARARMAREQAAASTDGKIRQKLLDTAALWDRMAEYEEQRLPRQAHPPR